MPPLRCQTNLQVDYGRNGILPAKRQDTVSHHYNVSLFVLPTGTDTPKARGSLGGFVFRFLLFCAGGTGFIGV